MIKEAIQLILDLQKAPTVEASGRLYAREKLSAIMEPRPSFLELTTLKGVVDWIRSDELSRLERKPSSIYIHVLSPSKVRVISEFYEEWMNRDQYIESELIRRSNFTFGSWMEIEQFIIGFQTSFVDNEAKQKIIKYLANIRSESVSTSADDGITQEVGMVDKINRISMVEIEPIVNLAPYRTFAEVKQPESQFLIRLKTQKDGLPLVALFTADGNAWKNTAIESIAKYFKEKIKSIKVYTAIHVIS